MGEAYQGVSEYDEEGYVVRLFVLAYFGEEMDWRFLFLLTGSVCRIDTGFVRCKACVSTTLVHFLVPYFCFIFTTLTNFFIVQYGRLGYHLHS